VRAHRDAAPYTYVEEVDFTELVSLRERLRPLAETAGVRLTYLPLILGAVSKALTEHPLLNATEEDGTGDLLVHARQDVGVAVHAETGLVVPVIRDLAGRNLLAVAAEIARLAEAARTGSLSRADLAGGTFSVTSLGRYGGLLATPMLNPPQVAILGIHRIAPRPVVREGQIVARQTAHVSLTLDHRYLDGYAGALFMESLRRYLEDPALLLFWLAELAERPA
jgi:pyruvate dehydrogenase E2 component (dihydrolipoamide acetyltransferase)